MILLNIEDFFAASAGRLQLVQANKTDDLLQAFIDDNEAPYIRKLYGVVLGNAVINYYNANYNTGSSQGAWDASTGVYPTNGSGMGGAIVQYDYWTVSVVGKDANGLLYNVGDYLFALIATPVTSYDWGQHLARIKAITDPFSLQVESGSIFLTYWPSQAWWGWEFWGWGYGDCLWPQIHESQGLKKFLMNMVFSEWTKDQSTQYSQSGVVTANAETSNVKNMENGFRFAETRYNFALETAAAIQWYCLINLPDTYPDFNGLAFSTEYSVLL